MQPCQLWGHQNQAPEHCAPSLEALLSHSALHGRAITHLEMECMSVQVLTSEAAAREKGCSESHCVHGSPYCAANLFHETPPSCSAMWAPYHFCLSDSHAGTQHGCTDIG